ncbi:FHA domain-containing protein [Fodinicola acaciae]|uniref:FHA domain-containing protein n=1 Tax=Fodinicola acaciae TaxID=2681555 RepID=UPI001C9E34B6|nr:FHA domain-containing protein [Fodinicola acaciae]
MSPTAQTSRRRSLAYAVVAPPDRPGTLRALTVASDYQVGPFEGRQVIFGRNREAVHVCVGEDDRRVSRAHGRLTWRRGQWWLENTGRQPMRLPDGWLLFPGEDPFPLPAGYTPLFVAGSGSREHLLEIFVTGEDGARPVAKPSDATIPPEVYWLSEKERLVLVVLGQRYLQHHSRPQPLTRQQVAGQLAELQPEAGWNDKMVERVIAPVRERLSRAGVRGLTREEVGEPVGNALNDNLLRALMESTALVPPDLALLDH